MNKNFSRKQSILYNKLFDQEDIRITHLMIFYNDKDKII